MKKHVCLLVYLFFLFKFSLIAQDKSEIKIYTDFLKKENTSAKEYIFSLFEKYDIVILCERDHRDITQYDLLHDIFRDKRFSDDIRHAYFEIGNYDNNDTLNAFLRNPNLSNEKVEQSILSFQRKSYYGTSLWEKANYSYNIRGVYNINKNLPADKNIYIHALDININWDNLNIQDLKRRDEQILIRDSIMGERMLDGFKKQNTNKALVVLNYRHAFLKDCFGRVNAGRFIEEAHKGKVANVLLNSFIMTTNPMYKDNIALTHQGKWDASFLKTGKNDLGFNLDNSPFGNDSFDMIPVANELKYKDVFTGFISYLYFRDIRIVVGLDNYIDDSFAPILKKKYMLEKELYNWNEEFDIETLKKEYNTVQEKTYKQEYPQLEKEIDQWLK